MTVDTLLTSPVIQLTPHLSHLPFLMENVDWALCLQFLFCQHLCRAAKPCSNVSWLIRLPPCPSQHGEFAPTGAPGGAPLQEEPGHSAAGADHTDQRGNPPPCFHLSSAFQSAPLMCCFSFITAPFASQSCPRLWPSITPSAITRNISSACPALLFPQTHSVPLLLQDTFFQPR